MNSIYYIIQFVPIKKMKLIFKYEEYREVRLYEIRDQRRHDACG